jgi:hypothetical protein
MSGPGHITLGELLSERIIEMATVRPGDSLILRLKPGGEIEQLAATLRDGLPEGTRVILVDADAVEVMVLRTGGQGESS